MFLALDIGNTQIKAGWHDGTAWQRVEHVPSDPAAEWPTVLARWAEDVTAVGMASVVPVLTHALTEATRRTLGFTPAIVSATLSFPFRLAYSTPETLGADRLAAAAAAWLQFGRNDDGAARAVVALDAGTALTTEVITADGTYLGGAIAPGPALLRQALAQGTAQLPEVDWPDTPYAVGDSTTDAIAAGLSTLFLDGVQGLLDRTAVHLQTNPFVVATGGWAPWLDRYLPGIHRVEPHLVLDGIRLLTESAA
ncbi:MAG: type III pantothenate kinase [Rhodothermaceae bacterium]|nr:type III pantothenate kinase [Rhodothermaceae bacterium]